MAYQQQTALMRPPAQLQYVQHQGPVFQQTAVAPDGQVSVRQKFARDTQKRCGIAQVVLGVLAMIVGANLMHFDGVKGGSRLGYSGLGMWSGVFMIIAGSFGILSLKKQTTSTIVTCMVMSIIASCFAFAMLVTSAIACVIFNEEARRAIGYISDDKQPIRVAMNSLAIVIGLTEIVVSIIQSSVCCRTTCCSGQQAPPNVVYVPQPFPAQYALQTQGVVQATNIPMGRPTPGVTVITPDTYHVGYTPPAQGAAGVVVPPAYSQTEPSPPEYTEK